VKGHTVSIEDVSLTTSDLVLDGEGKVMRQLEAVVEHKRDKAAAFCALEDRWTTGETLNADTGMEGLGRAEIKVVEAVPH
jgi:hypothetical protein